MCVEDYAPNYHNTTTTRHTPHSQRIKHRVSAHDTMVERALELNRLLQAKVKAELDRIEELIAANQRMQSRLDLLIKDAAVVHKATRYRMATFFVSLDKSVCLFLA